MRFKVHKAAVLGAGVMGAQIAALLAAAGVETLLLDLPSQTPSDDAQPRDRSGAQARSAPAIAAIERLQQLKPAPLYSPGSLRRIVPGNFDDDLPRIADVDWVIEVVAERLDIKQSLLERVVEHLAPHTLITTNTSGLLIESIAERLPPAVQQRFFGTHFFNPPRYMRLVEIIPGSRTDTEAMHALAQWIESRLGKGVVDAADRINFIGNRVGVFNLVIALHHMQELGLDAATVDAVTGALMGRPASATLRTIDVIGLDTFLHVARNVYDVAPDDPFHSRLLPPDWILDLIDRGQLGQKSGAGIYRKSRDAEGRTQILAWSPDQGDYLEQSLPQAPWLDAARSERDTLARLRLILAADDPAAEFVWRVLRDTLAYAALLVEEIAGGELAAIDNSLKWGFSWEYGPFELWQGIGCDAVLARMQRDGLTLPDWLSAQSRFYDPEPGSAGWAVTGARSRFNASTGEQQVVVHPPHRFFLPHVATPSDPRLVRGNASASLLDLGDGVACLSVHTKLNALDDAAIDMLAQSCEAVHSAFQGLVIANEGRAFSAGADLTFFLRCIEAGRQDEIERFIAHFQNVLQTLKFAGFPSVACPHGLTLGGGCELTLHASRNLLAGETVAGLVETSVGLLPGGGGTKELALRAYRLLRLADDGDPMPFLRRGFRLITTAWRSGSGLDAMESGLYPPHAHLSLSREHQVAKARAMVIEMAHRGYVAPVAEEAVSVPGRVGIAALMSEHARLLPDASEHDRRIAHDVATVLCGGDVAPGSLVGEQDLLDLERRAFVALCHEPLTAERIRQVVGAGKPRKGAARR